MIGTGAAVPDYFLSCPPLPGKNVKQFLLLDDSFHGLISQHFIRFPNISISIMVDWVEFNSTAAEFKTKKSY